MSWSEILVLALFWVPDLSVSGISLLYQRGGDGKKRKETNESSQIALNNFFHKF